jgi:hypothetical protein
MPFVQYSPLPGHDHDPVPEQQSRVAVDVDVGGVRDVVALALEEAHKRQLPLRDRLATWLLPQVRTVEADVVRRCSSRRVEIVKALPAPGVVRLPRVHGHLDEDRRTSVRALPDDERDRSPCASV